MAIDVSALDELLLLIEDYHDYNPSAAEVYTTEPTSLQFCKQVSKGLPCIYPTAKLLQSYKARHWTKNDLMQAVSHPVEVAVTPNGRADSICTISDGRETKIFLQPANLDMTVKELFEKLEGPIHEGSPVYYLQSQNGNLTSTPLAPLFEDLPRNFTFASDVLGEPEAVNIWIGDERSVTSAHRDPYENLYVVLRGSKVFTLWPPVDEVTLDGRYFMSHDPCKYMLLFLHYLIDNIARMFRTGCFAFDATNSTFSTVLDENENESNSISGEIPWVTIDPQLPRQQLNAEHPLYKYAEPQTIILEAGQMLYLPSGWYHHVAQRCGRWDDGSKAPCISVNYWVSHSCTSMLFNARLLTAAQYDQDYEGEKYVMRQLVTRLTQRVQQLNSAKS